MDQKQVDTMKAESSETKSEAPKPASKSQERRLDVQKKKPDKVQTRAEVIKGKRAALIAHGRAVTKRKIAGNKRGQ